MQQLRATAGAFAAILQDGSAVTWGVPEWGGDCSAVQEQLRGVRQVQGTGGAFAAIRKDLKSKIISFVFSRVAASGQFRHRLSCSRAHLRFLICLLHTLNVYPSL